MNQHRIIPTRNFLLGSEAVANVLLGRSNPSRFILIEGRAGTGKSTLANALLKTYEGSILYSVSELETPRSLVSGLVDAVHGFGVTTYTSRASSRVLHARLLQDLEYAGWPPLLLDEADRLDRMRNGISLLEVVRDIHDRGNSPIILFSIAHLARRLANPNGGYAEAFSSRIAAHVRFERASLEDGELLAQHLGLKFDADLIAHCVEVSRGSFRPLVGLFAEIERVAKAAGVNKLNLAKWKQLSSYAGMPASAPRRIGRPSEAPKAVA